MPRPTIVRIIWIGLLSVTLLAAAAWFGGRFYLAGSVMPDRGKSRLAGLEAPVEVLFDGRGIPRVYAESDADALRTLGWLHAGERLFQMELIRRLARGELAEIFGDVALPIDIRHRSFGFARRVEQHPPELDPDLESLLESYVAGINGYLEGDVQPPPEFVILGLDPEPWTVADVLTVAYYQSWYPNTLVQRLAEAWREIASKFGEPAGVWLAALPDWTEASVPELRMNEASNTWAVAPDRSASGHALHASDPHLDYTVAPGLWYAAGLHSSETLDLLGITVPGLPFIAMGHNGRIAWSFTVAPVDIFELYRQDRNPDDPDLVTGPDGWEAISRRTETIIVRGRETPVERVVENTERGIVLETDNDSVLTMHWAGFDFGLEALLENGLAIGRSDDFESFRRAATGMAALSVNWMYSDRQGNIGYVQGTPIPKRRHRRFFQVLDAGDAENIWDGYYPAEQWPHALNPNQGWLASANNHAAGPDWPVAIPGFYKHLRMRRISAWLGEDRAFEPADMVAMQLDRVSDRALAWKDWLAGVAERAGRTRLAAELRQWDAVMAADSETAGLFARWWQHLPRHLFDDLDQPDWRIMRVVLDNWLHESPEHGRLADIDRDRAALAALEQALDDGIRPLGRIQTLAIEHPMAQSAILDRWLKLSRGPIATGGDAGSLNVTYTSFDEQRATLRARAGASMRFVLDWSDPDQFALNLTLGQSGNPLSPHFDDFLPSFISGEPWTVPFKRDAVVARAKSTLVLKP